MASDLCSPPGTPPPRSAGALVIGYGNELRGDDGAGIRAATRLAGQASPAKVIITQQLTPDLAEDIASAARVIFVDAYAAQKHDAKLRIDRITGGKADSSSALGHRGDPERLLHIAEQLFGQSPEAWVLGIPAFNFDLGETTSPETTHLIDEAVALIRAHSLFNASKGDPK